MVVWSLLAWLAYAFFDPLLAWLAGALDVVVDQGRGAARTFGDKQVGDLLTTLDTSVWPGRLLAMMKATGQAVVVVVWIAGLLVLAGFPIALSILGRLYYGDRR